MKNTLAVILIFTGLVSVVVANDEDFAFESADDVADQFRHFVTDWSAPRQTFIVPVGRIFHLVVPKSYFGKDISKFEAKLQDGKPIPRWLMFDKIEAVFWGVPLRENIGTIDVVLKSLGSKKRIAKNIIIDVVAPSIPSSSVKKCSSSEDITILSLIIDKSTETIKPRQRVVAINNISKFFGIPYSAFTLRQMDEQDDTRVESVILAGPGNVKSRSSNFSSILEVPVGCDGRIFPQNIALIHQLKKQARDGTISEILRLSVAGWGLKVWGDRSGRERRQALDLGSGDYDGEYYDDYETDTEDYIEEDIEPKITPESALPKPPKTTPEQVTITTTVSTTMVENTSTHPHRHHHGEVKKDEINRNWPIVDDGSHNENNLIPTTSPEVPKKSSTAVETTTALKQPTTTTTTTTTEKATERTTQTTTTAKIELPFIPNTTDEEDYDGEYGIDDYEEENENDRDDIESETIVPLPNSLNRLIPTTTPIDIVTTTPTTTTTTTRTTTTTSTVKSVIAEEKTVSEETTTVKNIAVTLLPEAENTETETYVPTSAEATEVPVATEAETSTSTTTNPITTIMTTPLIIPTTSTILNTTNSPLTTAPTTSLTTTTDTPITTTSTTISAPTTISSSTTEFPEIEEATTSTKLTTLRHVSSATPSVTTAIEEEYFPRNDPPYIENRLDRKQVIAGKIFRFVIPEDTFKDSEDNYDLKLEVFDSEGKPLTANSWCQFNSLRREIYGLTLDDHVSKWEYIVRATDKDGASVQDRLTILVQQHKLQRVFNHEFSLEMRIERKDGFKHYIDWSLKTLRALGRIYNTNMSEITVRNISHTTQPVVFSWSNDSLPTNYCPKTEIERLFKILTANDRGFPSRELNAVVAPELRVKKVSYRGMGVCEELNIRIAPPVNYPPILINPVNHINATVGELLIFRVPKDTCYDPEDLDTTSLNVTLLTGDRQQIPPHSWLQFDSKNREFFGIPRKTSRNEYLLICIDSGGLPVIDGLEVVVHTAPKYSHNVEFSMTIETIYDKFLNSAIMQKKFVEKLVDIFGDKNSSHIRFLPFKQKQQSTIITWYNKTLATDKCPHEEIARLEAVMKNEDRGISHRVHSIMEPDFQVSTIKVLLMSNCKVHKPKYHTPKLPEDKIVVDESTQTTSSSDEYLLTFIIPAVVIFIMTFFALLAACILYRRRRTGKMNVVEDGRHGFGNKGIPVIFQEELDEKPEAGTKAPVILKDEKPPLAPPEYSKSGSLKFNDDSEPYHPPPPFTRNQDNSKQSRPKPAPTYRKPPPYVPP